MAGLVLLEPVQRLNSSRCGELTQQREGIMIHFDGSKSDAGAVEWFADPRCDVSYQRIYLDDGDVVEICGLEKRAWHAGVCRRTTLVRDANSAFYGLSIATDEFHPVTDAAFGSIVHDCAALMLRHGWGPHEVRSRIVGHNEWAVYPQSHKNPALRGRLGRKVDPIGLDPNEPILETAFLRIAVRHLLEQALHTRPLA